MRYGLIAGLTACAMANAATAQQLLPTTSAVFVERPAQMGGGMEIARASDLRRGDTVLLVVEWTAQNRTGDFTISSRIPKELAFQRASIDAHSVSVDGGKNWGQLGELRIGRGTQTRKASVEDITHLRWRVPPRAVSGGKGRITYSAIVR